MSVEDAAREICQSCSVKFVCRDFARDNHEYGLWALKAKMSATPPDIGSSHPLEFAPDSRADAHGPSAKPSRFCRCRRQRNVDLVATTPRHPLPGETLIGTDFHEYPGGKGLNQAVASARAGARTVHLCGR